MEMLFAGISNTFLRSQICVAAGKKNSGTAMSAPDSVIIHPGIMETNQGIVFPGFCHTSK